MSRFIGTESVAVQVEANRTSVWVPDGRAVRRRGYHPEGIPLAASMVFHENLDREATTTPFAGFCGRAPRNSPKFLPLTRVGEDFSGKPVGFKDVNVGPILAHTRVPVVVSPGDRVSMSGQFAVRRTGLSQSDGDTNANFYGLDVRVVIWGIGRTIDEYGVETPVEVELLSYQALLQTFGGIPGVAQVTYTIPGTSPATVPANVDRVVLSIALIDNRHDRGYIAATYEPTIWGSTDTRYITLSTATPVRLHTYPPADFQPISAHPLSSTGVAFENRRYYTGTSPGCVVTLLSPPGATGPVNVNVYRVTGTVRGPLLTTVVVPAGQRAQAAVTSSTGQIELASTSTVWVESVLAPEIDTLAVRQDALTRIDYTDVTLPVSTIVSESVEADLGVLTLRFLSDTLAESLGYGKRVRVLGKYPGGFRTVFTGIIRKRKLVRDFKGKMQLEVAVHDAFPKLGVECGVAYETPSEYQAVLNALGCEVQLLGANVGGPARDLPNGHAFFPSYASDGLELSRSVMMLRNSMKGFLTVDRHDRIVLRDSLPDPVLDVSDQPGQGHMSFSREIEFQSDTTDLVNIVSVTEHLLDHKSYDDRTLGSDSPPTLLDHTQSKTQSVDYRRLTAIELYGQSRVSFDVIRGSGSLDDLTAGNYGTRFEQWATAVLDDRADEELGVRSLRLLVTTDTISLVAGLELLDAVVVRIDGTATVRRIRKVRHEIRPGRWICILDFTTSNDMAYWLPDTPVPVLTLGDTDAGHLSAPSTGLIDGGAPGDTVTALLDGGEL